MNLTFPRGKKQTNKQKKNKISYLKVFIGRVNNCSTERKPKIWNSFEKHLSKSAWACLLTVLCHKFLHCVTWLYMTSGPLEVISTNMTDCLQWTCLLPHSLKNLLHVTNQSCKIMLILVFFVHVAMFSFLLFFSVCSCFSCASCFRFTDMD